MILWTIQTLDWYEALCEAGVMVSQWEFVDSDWVDAYRWMSTEMTKRIGSHRDSPPPIWAWYQYKGDRPRPDLRCCCHLPRGTKGVRIEFQTNAKSVLLSDFQKWHAILNVTYLADTEEESDRWSIVAKSLSPREKQSEIRKTWARVFDTDVAKQDDYWTGPEGPQIQACLWELKSSDVAHVTHFIAR